MSYIQIISVCEGRSDELYLRKIFNYYLEKTKKYNVKYDFVLLKGKTNFNKSNVLKSIKEKEKKYKTNTGGISYIVYFIDTDNVNTNSKDISLYNDILKFIKKNSYELVFFNKNIEEVINKDALKKEKTREAKAYIYNYPIENRLKIEDFKMPNSSNLLLILKKIVQC